MALYKCSTCQGTFTQERRLRRHQRVYRCFKCGYFGERFSTRGELALHLESHRRAVGIQTNSIDNLGCKLMTPSKFKKARTERGKQASSVETSNRPINLLGSDSEDASAAKRTW